MAACTRIWGVRLIPGRAGTGRCAARACPVWAAPSSSRLARVASIRAMVRFTFASSFLRAVIWLSAAAAAQRDPMAERS
jgi:hypothetical protein